MLEQKLADADVSEEDQNNLLKFLEKKETEYMRLQRHKLGVADFDLLTMIGKGAFGEVNACMFSWGTRFLIPVLLLNYVLLFLLIRLEFVEKRRQVKFMQ